MLLSTREHGFVGPVAWAWDRPGSGAIRPGRLRRSRYRRVDPRQARAVGIFAGGKPFRMRSRHQHPRQQVHGQHRDAGDDAFAIQLACLHPLPRARKDAESVRAPVEARLSAAGTAYFGAAMTIDGSLKRE